MTADNPTNNRYIPGLSVATAHTGKANKADALGMRPMQQRAYQRRGEQYLLVKSPPASGKSRALMFIALDKLHNQSVKQVIITVPERSIGSSFADEKLAEHGFYWDWTVKPEWNLCSTPGPEFSSVAKSKVKAVEKFLASEDTILVCTHATFRFAVEALGVAALDGRLIAIDEFHHVSTSDDSVLGTQLSELITRDKAHIVAMTGSFFRGDSVAVLSPEDERKFETVTYTLFEQLNGYTYLKVIDLGYFFYTGSYLDSIHEVLDPALKTIVHIPNVNARESVRGAEGKRRDVEDILNSLGDWKGVDKETGFYQIELRDSKRIIKVADLVDDSDADQRSRILAALKDPAQKNNRDHVDIIIALGMAKEGFDWIWCEHALTIGYRNSLTEIIQIIGRATRDAEGKERTRFTNFIAEPDASEATVAQAVNDTLKAISASLLMEQVLAPRFEFTPKNAGPQPGFDYGEGGYNENGANLGVNEEAGTVHVEIKGLKTPASPEAARIIEQDLTELYAEFVQDGRRIEPTAERGLFDTENTTPEDLTQRRMGAIVRERYPHLSEEDQEAVRECAIASMVTTQEGAAEAARNAAASGNSEALPRPNTALIDGIRKFIHVQDLHIDLIDSINPFGAAYSILSVGMNQKVLQQIRETIAAKKVNISEEEATRLANRAKDFRAERGRMPDFNSPDPFERQLAEGVAAFTRYYQARKAAEKAESEAK